MIIFCDLINSKVEVEITPTGTENSLHKIMEKASLPTKTKIAAWYSIIIGIILIVGGIIWVLEGIRPEGYLKDPFINLLPGILLIILGSLLNFFSLFLFKKKEWAWSGLKKILILCGIGGILGFCFFFLAAAWTMAPMGPGIFWFGLFILVASPIFIAVRFLGGRRDFFKTISDVTPSSFAEKTVRILFISGLTTLGFFVIYFFYPGLLMRILRLLGF